MATRLSKIDGGGTSNLARVPPHNLEAEESVLGACLLSRQAIATALETLEADDFYKPAHAEMFRIMLDLYARGEPLDAVTLGEELKRRGNLDDFGGRPYLFTLVSSVPSPGSVGHYARIVQENATLRRLIEASQQIGDLAFALPEDVEQAVDQSEDLIYQVTNRRSSEELAALKDLLTENMELVEKLYERGSAITGVATGFTDLDELTAGLQPSNLIIVAARPSMGKALALDTPLPTPEGWVTMGEILPGDEVFDERGHVCRVTHISEIYTDHDCYEVVFDDGSQLVADRGHQWVAWDEAAVAASPAAPGDTPWARVITTAQLVAEGLHWSGEILPGADLPGGPGSAPRPRWSVGLADPLDLPALDLPTDPYVLGCWLGDQYAGGPERSMLGRDRAHFSGEFEQAGYCLGLHAQQGCFVLGTSPVRATGAWQGDGGPGRALAQELEALDLGRGSVKCLPAEYLRGSFKQRLALLQGLMDSAGMALPGEAGTAGQVTVELNLASPDLLDQARELACSLGHSPGAISAVPGSARRRGFCLRWQPLDPVFRMERKAAPLAEGLEPPAHDACLRRSVVAIRPVPAVAVRCIQVDAPSRLYLAGESMIPTHNSALALSIAQHVATNDHVPVVIFSLEMSKMELVQRLMCSEARVDSNRLRKGALQDSDWPKLSLALGRLAEAPIFIDDTPNATIMEMRAKCRRVKSKSGLGLVIIDYLQLMAPLKRTDNRVQEVSEISRSLKILARELDVPVIALSQLSRNVEYRADKRPLLADLRESGCMPASTRVMRADNGEEITLGELVLTQVEPMVWSVDSRQRLVPAKMLKAFPSGIKPVFRLKLASGRDVSASANHPFLTINGWQRLDGLEVGNFIATPRRLPAPILTSTGWSDDELILLGHLLGDGTMGVGFKYATADPANKAIVEDTASRLFGIETKGPKVGNTWQCWFPSPYRLTHGINHPMRTWLEPHGLYRSRAWTKFIPQSIFGCSDAQVALFLRHLWATDGSVTVSKNGQGPVVTVYYSSTSHRLALDVQRLLLRLGIRSAIGVGHKKRSYETVDGENFYRDSYVVRIQGAGAKTTFLRLVGCYGQRGDCIPACLEILAGIKENPNVDLVPWPVAEQVKAAAALAGVTHRQLAESLGEAYGGSYLLGSETRQRRFSRGRLHGIAELVGSTELSDIASSDLYWDEVIEITPRGDQPTFDVTIEGSHNFIADGIVAHNSIEQDADVVMFIYRDEVYNADSPQRGIAELHISKHRSGPIGKVELTFLSHYTKFANLARGL